TDAHVASIQSHAIGVDLHLLRRLVTDAQPRRLRKRWSPPIACAQGERNANRANRWQNTASMRAYGPAALRLCVGAVFLMHGAQRLFGLLGGPGLAGTAETLASLRLPDAPGRGGRRGRAAVGGGGVLNLGLR